MKKLICCGFEIEYKDTNRNEVYIQISTPNIMKNYQNINKIDSEMIFEYRRELLIGIVKKCAVRKHPKSKIGMYQAT